MNQDNIISPPSDTQIQALLQQLNLGSEFARVEEGKNSFTYRVQHAKSLYYLSIPRVQERIEFRDLHLKSLRQAGVRAPEPIAYANHEPLLDGASFLLMREIPGEALGFLAPINNDVAKALGYDLGRAHAIATQGFGRMLSVDDQGHMHGQNESEYIYFTQRLNFEAQWRDKQSLFYDTDILPRAQLDKLLGFIKDHAFLLEGLPSGIVHGDLGGAHIYIDKGHYTGLIDWGRPTVGSGLIDFVKLSIYNPQINMQVLLQAYQTKHDFMKDEHFDRRLLLARTLFCLTKVVKKLQQGRTLTKRYKASWNQLREDAARIAAM